ncbi:hypothetical protein [Leeuwenhoekiella aestuarii]|uniref:ParG protein n=1 Tax=Leeuwenhoekiella aestuarii TaxID=2249426 RepID=A0A4Q0NTX5_9FLAO|nr:hypothetical protein [Leeuwenhoekiella aestuarii]RXG13973.1 hypothetical protein DSM04_10477 [Leeuwenhoekiella aestuarii]
MSKAVREPDLIRVIFNAKPSFKKKIKVAAARKGITMTELITSSIEEKLTKNK